MAKNKTIIQGFVDLNLETDEKSFYKKSSNLTSISFKEAKSKSLQYLQPPLSIEEIASIVNISPESIRAAHIQGSRLYGVDNQFSDWDISIVSTDIDSFYFVRFVNNGQNYDVSSYSPELFKESLQLQKMKEVEFVFHPIQVRIIDEIELDYALDKQVLLEKVIEESDDLWNRAKIILESGQNVYSGLKNIWHSFRFLIFAKQLIIFDEINDFSAANYLYDSIINSKETDFQYFFNEFYNLREQMKQELQSLL